MGINNIRFDNPIDFENLPRERLVTKVPARGRPNENQTWRLGARILLSVLAWTVFLCGLAGAPPEFSQTHMFRDLHLYASMSLTIYLLAIISRPIFQAPKWIWGPLAAGWFTTFCVMSNESTRHECGYGISTLFGAFVHWSVEVVLHRHRMVVDNVLNDKPRPHDNFWERLIPLGIVFIVAFTISTFLEEWTGVLVFNIFMWSSGFWGAARQSSGGEHGFWTQLESLLFYPSAKRLPPGVIATSAGEFVSRFTLVGFILATGFVYGIQPFIAHRDLSGVAWCVMMPLTIIGLTQTLLNISTLESCSFQGKSWIQLIDSLRNSANPLERESIYLANVADDNSLVLVDRSLCNEHMHVVGATGASKSSVVLAPLIEQFLSFPDTSVVVIDLKGDTPELYYSAVAAIDRYRPKSTIRLFNFENGAMSHVYNPFFSEAWDSLSTLERSDVLCSCCGLVYGQSYGKAFFSMGNASVMTNLNIMNPNGSSFRQLAVETNRILEDKNSPLSAEFRRVGLHAIESIRRLACYDTVNYRSKTLDNDLVYRNRIDLADLFQEPSVAYFRLPSPVASISAPALARFVVQNLIIAGKTQKRKIKVHLVIDEFQRAIGEGIEQTLQMARSHGIGLVLCNQSMADLQVSSPTVYQAVAGNCAIRRWLSVNSLRDLQELFSLMGTTEVIKEMVSNGPEGQTVSFAKEQEPRARMTDLHTISEETSLSILQVSGRGRGYARYKGIPFVCRSQVTVHGSRQQNGETDLDTEEPFGTRHRLSCLHQHPPIR